MAGKPVDIVMRRGNSMSCTSIKNHAFSLSATALLLFAGTAPLQAQLLPHVHHVHATFAAADSRLTVTVRNEAEHFRDVRIAGHVYTVMPNHILIVTAPAGTLIYAASNMSPQHSKGSVLASVEPGQDTIRIN